MVNQSPSQLYGTVLRIYDNGGRSADRYTIIPPRWAHEFRNSRENGWAHGANRYAFDGIASSEDPYNAQGFGMHVSGVMPGPHLGKRIRWGDLPADVQRFARQAFPGWAPGAPATVGEIRNALIASRYSDASARALARRFARMPDPFAALNQELRHGW